MANLYAPFGFRPVRRVDGASWTGNMSPRKIAANNTNYFYSGDPVMSATSGYIVNMTAAAAVSFAGIFIGCEYLSVSKGYVTWSPFFPGGDTVRDVTAWIIDDPFVLFEVQTNNSAGGATAAGISAIGNTAEIGYSNYSNGLWSTGGTAGSSTCGNTLNGKSGVYLDQNSFSNSTGSGYPFKIYDIPNVQTSGSGLPTGSTVFSSPGNGYDATTPYNVALVTVNAGDLRAGVAGI